MKGLDFIKKIKAHLKQYSHISDAVLDNTLFLHAYFTYNKISMQFEL